MTRVSVVIPAHNAAALNQTHPPAEILVIDDGSSDATPDIARAYGPSVTCLSTPNRGVSAARNTGIAESRREFVAFLDADDMWEPTKLERQVQMLDADSE